MAGTVNISRDLWDDPDFPKEKFSEREAWMWLIAEASWKPRRFRLGNAVFDLKRGQAAVSVRFLAEHWMWSKSTVQRFLKKLEKRDSVRLEGGTAASLITICKYDEYQNIPNSDGTHVGHDAGQQWDMCGTKQNKDEIKITKPREALPAASSENHDQTNRERLLAAMGADPVSGMIGPNGVVLGNVRDNEIAKGWGDLGLSLDQQCAVIAEVLRRIRAKDKYFSPRSFGYFTGAMNDAATGRASVGSNPGRGPAADPLESMYLRYGIAR